MIKQPYTVLSVCISSYNKGSKCVDLVEKILNLQDDRIDIVICDDNSDDVTVHALESIKNEKVAIHYNHTNIGPCANWYETINQGKGAYILHVLDRDYIDIRSLKMLVEYLDNNEVGVGYIGNYFIYETDSLSQGSFTLFEAGEDTLMRIGGVPLHPTGFFIKKTVWDSQKFKRFFYEDQVFGIYPHTYVLGRVCLDKNVLLAKTVFCRYVYSQASKSCFYIKKKKPKFWWEPSAVFETNRKITDYFLDLFDDADRRQSFIVNSFKDAIVRGTIGYRNELLDKRQMAHYGQEVRSISLLKLFIINVFYTYKFIINPKI